VKSSHSKNDGSDPLLIISEKYRLKTVSNGQLKKIKKNAKLATIMKRTGLNYIRQAKTRELLKN
jgi:hypothetical protein